jgi:hypothetical protein
MYKTWWNMISRCHKIKHKDYPRYGGRGINVCKRWVAGLDYFIEDMGMRPEGKSLDRIDNNRGYYPKNCKWSTRKGQASNRRKTYNISIKGKRHKNSLSPKAKGERHGLAVLPDSKIEQIRTLYKLGVYTYVDLGNLFCTTPVTIRNYILNKTRKKT